MRAVLLLTLLLAGAAQAESLADYGRQCAAEVTPIPAFDCLAGEEIPITVNGVRVQPGSAPAACDRPSLLPQQGGDGQNAQCMPGSRALVLRDDATAQISAICRQQIARPAGSPWFDEINVVSHNLKNGKTCWFTAKAQRPLRVDGGLNGRRVPSPSRARPDPAADQVWLPPAIVAQSSPPCIQCHDSGPFMYSPYIAQTTQLPGDPFGRYAPKALGADFKRAWAGIEVYGLTTRGNTCTACHRMGHLNSCRVAMQQSTGQAPQQGGDDWSKQFPQSHWMSPGDLHSQAQWDQQFKDSVQKLAACCANPKAEGCEIVRYEAPGQRR